MNETMIVYGRVEAGRMEPPDFRFGGKDFAPTRLPAGTVVEVIEATPDGERLLVEAADGRRGWAYSTRLRSPQLTLEDCR